MIDFNKFDFPSIFGVVKSTDGLKRQQMRFFRAEVQELAIAKYSGGQLKYVGDTENGRDFLGVHDGLYYESKGLNGLFQKRTPYTKEITLKNYHTNKTGLSEKTFDYMLLWDTKNYTAGICSWDSCTKKKNIKLKAAGVNFKVHYNDITFIARNVIPKERGDFGAKLYSLIKESI
tara:strand:+ start:56 stop:580 length:525 start_codon:yes stop_codon:yes gene_type:complete